MLNDPTTDLPIRHHHYGIHGTSGSSPGLFEEMTQVGQQRVIFLAGLWLRHYYPLNAKILSPVVRNWLLLHRLKIRLLFVRHFCYVCRVEAAKFSPYQNK